MVLGRDLSATVVIEGWSEGRLRLYTNIGQITQPQEGPPGRLEATYTPLTGVKYPHVAIVVAGSDDNRVFAWTAIRLVGSASVKIETKPDSDVRLRVGTIDYGPVRTDTQGIVRINVQVPPGVTQATSFVTDTLGNASTSLVDLLVPTANRIFAVCPAKGDRILLFGVDKTASPLIKPKIVIKSFPVTTGALNRLSDGVFTSSIDLPESENAGDKATWTAALADDPVSTTSCTIDIPRKRITKSFVTENLATDRAEEVPRKTRWSLSLRLGYLSNLGWISSPVFSIALGLRLPFTDYPFIVSAETGYYGNKTTEKSANKNYKVGTSVTAFPLLARILYQFTIGPVYLSPGLGAGVLFANAEVTSTQTGTSRVFQPYFLLAGFLESSIQAGPGRVLADLGYWHSRVDETWVRGNLGGLHGAVGYELEF